MMGESKRIREIKMTSASAGSEKPLNKTPEIEGMRKYARPETIIIKTEKKEKMLLIKVLRVARLSASFSIMNGIRTESDTTEATVTKIKSGIRKAA